MTHTERSVESEREPHSETGEGRLFASGDARTKALARMGGQRSGLVRRMSVSTRQLAEEGFREAIQAMMDEVQRLLKKRWPVIAGGHKQLSQREESRLWFLVVELASAQ